MIIHVCSLEPNEGNQGYQPCFWWSQPEIFQWLIHHDWGIYWVIFQLNPHFSTASWTPTISGRSTFNWRAWSPGAWSKSGQLRSAPHFSIGTPGKKALRRWTHRRSPTGIATTGFSVSMAQGWISERSVWLCLRKGIGVPQGSSKIHWIRTECSTFFHSHWEVYRYTVYSIFRYIHIFCRLDHSQTL